MFELFVKLGSCWKTIGDRLSNKTDHFIKNHFYSHVKIFLRKINKLAGGSKNQKEINQLKSAVLTSLFSIAEEIEFYGFKDFFEFFIDIEETYDIRDKIFGSELREGVVTLLDKLTSANSLYIKNKPLKKKVKRIRKSTLKSPETILNKFITEEKPKTSKNELLVSLVKIVKSNSNSSSKFLETYQNSEYLNTNKKSEEAKWKLNTKENLEVENENFKNGLFVDILANEGKEDFGGEELFSEDYAEFNDEYLLDIMGDFSLNK